MSGSFSKEQILKKLKEIAERRNQIVHESDIILKKKAKQISQREIKYSEAEEAVKWIRKFVLALNKVIAENFD